MHLFSRSALRNAAAGLLLWVGIAWCGSCTAATNVLRFAWLSDTHVGSTTGEADLRAAVEDINALAGVSFVILSGDLTEYGSWEQLKLARDILGGLKIPVHIIPGNHDTKWSESGATDFARLWGADRFVFEAAGYRFIGMHQGPLMKMGDGHWAPQDVRWLTELLQGIADKTQPILFVTHYPIDSGIDNWYAVLDLLKKCNTQVVLCGHGHANRKMNFEGIPGVMGRSNLRVKAPQGAFNIVEVSIDTMTFSERTTGVSTKAPWHIVRLAKPNFEAETNSYPRPDFSINERYPDVKTAWTYDAGYTIASTPGIAGDLAIVGDASGSVVALDLEKGARKWKFQAKGAVYSSPGVERQKVVFGCTDGRLYALDCRDGRLLWTYETQRPIVSSPSIAGGVVYIGASDGKFRAFNLESGKLLWEFAGLKGFVETKPLVCDDWVIFGAWDQHLYCLKRANGEEAWTWRGDKAGVLYSPAACWPVAANSKVFIAAPDRKLTAIHLSAGNTVWRTGDYEVRESIGLSSNREVLYVRLMNNDICAFSTKTNQPDLLWRTNVGFGYDINSAMLQEKDGIVFYGTKNGLVLALDGRTGGIQWQHKIGPGLVNTVVPVSASQVLTADFDGRVRLLVSSGGN